MSHPAAILLALSWRDKLESMSWLELLLWFGLAMLTGALLVLMGTRWGQVRPVSKCVVLSVFAHILFLCYAYGTSLSLSGGSLVSDPFVRVSLLTIPDEEDDASFDTAPASADHAEPNDSAASKPAEEIADPPGAPAPETPSTETPAAPAATSAPELLPDEHPAPQSPPTNPSPPPVAANPVSDTPPAGEQTPPDIEPAAPTPSATLPVFVTQDIQVDTPEVPDTVLKPDTSSGVASTTPSTPADEAPSSRAEPSPPTAAGGPTGSDSPRIAVANSIPAPSLPRPETPTPPESYRLRSSPDRLRLAIPLGASEESELAVAAALKWLSVNQQGDGRWDASEFGAGRETRTLGQDRRGAGTDADTGITGLALLAFLGAGHTHLAGPYREVVQHGLEFLIRSQHADGNLAGDAKLFERMYCHGIASVAVGEAFAMSRDTRLVPFVRRAAQYTLAAQDRATGGWRYQPGEAGDTSQFGWQVMALCSAELGGLSIPPAHRTYMAKFLDSVSQGAHRGLASYRPGERATRTMTAEALTCCFFLQLPVGDAKRAEAIEFVMRELPGQGEPNLYYWYYATLSLFQTQGPEWRLWNEFLQRQLLEGQRRDGPFAGSWDTHDVWGGYGGRIYTTSMAALCLEVYYRYLPLYGGSVTR
jgi:hypothetical protein